MEKKVYIKTYGCQMNEYDSDKMFDVLKADHNVKSTDCPEDADIILFNTCSIREKAQEKVFSDLGRVKKIKDQKKDLIVGVGGCVASQEGEQIFKRASHVDIVFGPQTLHRLPNLIKKKQKFGKKQIDISFPEIEKFDHLPHSDNKSFSAFISIMEGCSKYCSYCVVPYTRGEEVSRNFEDVLEEVFILSKKGVKEVTLLGQNVNAYKGKIIDGDYADFALLIEYIANIKDIKRIRYVTSHPKDFSDRLIKTYSKTPKLVNHLYLPIQHGSDKVLTAMKRGYTVLEYKSIIRRLRKLRPDISISSDFIVGFPGESEKDFENLINLVREIKFDNSFSFLYSPRPGTPASNLLDNTPQNIKLKRLKILQNIIAKNTLNYSNEMIGSTQKILVDGLSKRSTKELQGRTENNRVVNFEGGKNALNLIGEFIDIKITSCNPFSLRGKII